MSNFAIQRDLAPLPSLARHNCPDTHSQDTQSSRASIDLQIVFSWLVPVRSLVGVVAFLEVETLVVRGFTLPPIVLAAPRHRSHPEARQHHAQRRFRIVEQVFELELRMGTERGERISTKGIQEHAIIVRPCNVLIIGYDTVEDN